MPLPIGDTVGILADNLRIRKSVLPVSAKSAVAWARGLGLARGGETILYTGRMYQLMPYIEALNKVQEKIEDSWIAEYVKFGRVINRLINISALMALPSKSMRESCVKILVNIARLLGRAGVNFGYLYEEDLYSGALIYDLGVDDILEAHARRVMDVFKKYRVKKVITVDPHTTHMLRSVCPNLIKGYDLRVKSYLEVLAERELRPQKELRLETAIHDSCLYARHENVLREQRILLEKAGIDVREPAESGKFTFCCGGPAESLFPRKAKEYAKKRVDQIKKVSFRAVTMCPICLVNLQKAAGGEIQLEDISSYLVQAYCGG
ncbi:(Fe-S)-binding protein [Desulfofundulus thermosubterraneus]|uniref:Fe-S oxidoreductase n=1 Tax=Desulfofundulus thermosubterraneus DSM 16057 TaxID=1121432 RepID=A0A1M6JNJ4_9FIRM|nr:(Fe-S)-binding protein [Desulfofundulus thermosubterraneus]SHJ48123.1 Fe-S oxidoreductase [Desulfofundulus thermosubterraneus DSM 16057]